MNKFWGISVMQSLGKGNHRLHKSSLLSDKASKIIYCSRKTNFHFWNMIYRIQFFLFTESVGSINSSSEALCWVSSSRVPTEAFHTNVWPIQKQLAVVWYCREQLLTQVDVPSSAIKQMSLYNSSVPKRNHVWRAPDQKCVLWREYQEVSRSRATVLAFKCQIIIGGISPSGMRQWQCYGHPSTAKWVEEYSVGQWQVDPFYGSTHHC